MASQSKTKTVKFEVGQLVKFSGHRVGRVSRIAKNGAIYVIEIGDPTEELRVKKADLQLVEGSQTIPPVAPKGWDKIEAGHEVEKEVSNYPPVQLTLGESIQQTTQDTIAASNASHIEFPDAAHALRELTFSVARHSILTAFIDVAMNRNIPGYHYRVAGNIKNLMTAAFDPVHDAVGYARINTWMWAALELVVKHKNRVANMLNQPIEAAPIKIDRVTKLGMWIDNMMNNKGPKVNDMTSADDSCYRYNAIGKKLETCTFVVVEVIQSGDQGEMSVIPLPALGQASPPYQEHLTVQSAIAARKQYIDYYRPTEPDLHLYCGIVPVYKTGRVLQAAIEDVLASVIGNLK